MALYRHCDGRVDSSGKHTKGAEESGGEQWRPSMRQRGSSALPGAAAGRRSDDPAIRQSEWAIGVRDPGA